MNVSTPDPLLRGENEDVLDRVTRVGRIFPSLPRARREEEILALAQGSREWVGDPKNPLFPRGYILSLLSALGSVRYIPDEVLNYWFHFIAMVFASAALFDGSWADCYTQEEIREQFPSPVGSLPQGDWLDIYRVMSDQLSAAPQAPLGIYPLTQAVIAVDDVISYLESTELDELGLTLCGAAWALLTIPIAFCKAML